MIVKILKRKVNLILCLILMITFALNFSSCATEPPALEEVKEEFISLISSSAEINQLFFGEGLPVYDRNGTEEEKQVYSTLGSELDNYQCVREGSKYLTVESMKTAAEAVYTEEYLESVYQIVFDGYADDIMGVTAARYYESNDWIFESMLYEPLIEGTRTYDYETMKIVKPSTGEYVNVSIESELEGEKLTITLAFSKTENGWRLDTPTY